MTSIAGEIERDIQLALSCGQRVYFAIDGDSGSGKTTTLQNLLRSLEYKALAFSGRLSLSDGALPVSDAQQQVQPPIHPPTPVKLTSTNLRECLEYQCKRTVCGEAAVKGTGSPARLEGVFYADYYDISSFSQHWIHSTMDELAHSMKGENASIGAIRTHFPIVLILDDLHTIYQLFSLNGHGAMLRSFLMEWPGHVVFTTLEQDFIPYYLDPEKSGAKDEEQEGISVPLKRHILVRYPLSFGGGIATITRRLVISHPLLGRDNTTSIGSSYHPTLEHDHISSSKVAESCRFLALMIPKGITAEELNHAIFHGREKLRSVKGDASLGYNKNVSVEWDIVNNDDLSQQLTLFEEGFLAALQNGTGGSHLTTIIRYVPDSLLNTMERLSLLISLHKGKHTSINGKDMSSDVLTSTAPSSGGNRSHPVSITMGPVGMATKTTSGILIHGASGTGKTALLKKLAQDFPSVPFFFVPSHTLFGKYLGESEERLREVFGKTRLYAPCVLVLDNIDVLAQKRSKADEDGGSMDVTKRMLAALLCELDGFEENTGVLVIGTTNTSPDTLDSALIRQGRLETLVQIPVLSYEDCMKIFKEFLDSVLGEDIRPNEKCDMNTEDSEYNKQMADVNCFNSGSTGGGIVSHLCDKSTKEFDFGAAAQLLRIADCGQKENNKNLVAANLSFFYTGRPLCSAERAMRLLLEVIISEVK